MNESVGEKRCYQPPQLVVYGPLRHLTQAGTGSNAEGQPTNGSQCGLTNKQYQSPCP